MSSSSDSSSSSGSGATHTVIVAPTQGVLRFVPFAVNASVGDTVKFMWGANNHTVTKSSELTPCNKTSDNLFASGEQNLGFVFEQVVNDTNPIFFYCGTPTHCEKGMFGIINPPNALGAPTSVSGMMQSLLVSNPDLSAYNAYTEKQTSGKGAVNQWGGNIDLASLPEWSQPYVAQNVLYTRNLVASNPDILQGDGSINVGAAGSNPLMIPQDISAYLSSAVPSAAASTPAPAVTSAAAPASSAPASTGSMSNGASSMASPKVVVGLVAAFATFLVL
jgi:plastocyanin